MRRLESKRILPHACFLGSSSTYFPFESVVGVLVKSSVTREDGRQKGGWWKKERGRKGGRVIERLLDIFQGREPESPDCYIQISTSLGYSDFSLEQPLTIGHWFPMWLGVKRLSKSQCLIHIPWKYPSLFFTNNHYMGQDSYFLLNYLFNILSI